MSLSSWPTGCPKGCDLQPGDSYRDISGVRVTIKAAEGSSTDRFGRAVHSYQAEASDGRSGRVVFGDNPRLADFLTATGGIPSE